MNLALNSSESRIFDMILTLNGFLWAANKSERAAGGCVKCLMEMVFLCSTADCFPMAQDRHAAEMRSAALTTTATQPKVLFSALCWRWKGAAATATLPLPPPCFPFIAPQCVPNLKNKPQISRTAAKAFISYRQKLASRLSHPSPPATLNSLKYI